MNHINACIRSEPTVFENYVHDIYVEDQLVELSLWDTAGTVDTSLCLRCASPHVDLVTIVYLQGKRSSTASGH